MKLHGGTPRPCKLGVGCVFFVTRHYCFHPKARDQRPLPWGLPLTQHNPLRDEVFTLELPDFLTAHTAVWFSSVSSY